MSSSTLAPSELTVRKVEIDFSDGKVHWNPAQPEFCQFWNALSIAMPYLEQFLIKVMRDAEKALPASAPDGLKRDIGLFNSQEGRHYKLHQTFNELMLSDGYSVEPAAKKMADDYNRFRRDRGLKFGVAYCEGFETFGPMLSSFFFDCSEDYLVDWDEPTTFLWLWHTGEEFEHRTVVNYTYKELYGGYFYRIYGLWFAAVHLFTHALTLAPALLKEDLEKGRINGKWRSRARYVRFFLRLQMHVLPKFIKAHSPSYDPHDLKASSTMLEFLEKVKDRYNAREVPDDVAI